MLGSVAWGFGFPSADFAENMLGCILSWWSWILSWDLASCWARKGSSPDYVLVHGLMQSMFYLSSAGLVLLLLLCRNLAKGAEPWFSLP